MPWVFLDDKFPEHTKVNRAGGDAAWLYVAGLCYVNRNLTGGLVEKAVVPRLTDRRGARRLAERLVDVGLWEDADAENYRVHDYQQHNASAEKHRLAKERKSAQARAAANARWHPDECEPDADAYADVMPEQYEPDAVPRERAPSPNPQVPSNKSSSGEPLGAKPSDDDDRYRKLAEADLAQREAQKGQVGNREAWLVAATNQRRSAGNLEPPQARPVTPAPSPPTVQPPDFVAAEGDADWGTGKAEIERIKAEREALRAGGTK